MDQTDENACTDAANNLAEENLRLAQRCLELEEAARRRIAKLESLTALLKSNDSDMRRLVEDVAFGFILLNKDQTLINANQAACDMMGRSLSDISGLDFRQFVYVEKLAAFSNMIEAAMKSRQASTMEIDLTGVKGQLVPCRMSVSPWLDSTKGVQGVLVLAVDSAKEAQTDELIRRLRLNSREHQKSRDIIIGIVGRELAPPANAIIGMTRMLMETELSERQRELASVILSSADSLVRLVDSIGEMSSMGSDDMKLSLGTTNVLRLCRSVAAFFSARAEEKGLDLDVVLGLGVPEAIVADGLCLRRVLTHLVDNAVKFTKQGRVTISIDVIADKIRFMVSDTGQGLYSGAGEEIFDEYAPSRTTSARRYGGLGVGLSVCRRLVGLMGGKIGFDSVADKGSEFHFTIPLVVASPEETAAAARIDALPDAAAVLRLPVMKMLVTAANPLLARQLSAMLGLDGHETTMVENGFDAAERARRENFDLLLLDLQTAKLDGVQTLKVIRDHEKKNQTIPAVLLAPEAMRENFETFVQEGFGAVVAKPIDPAALMTAIRDATGVEPVGECSGGICDPVFTSVRRVNMRQLANIREMMDSTEFVGILQVFMEDSVPDVIRIIDMAEKGDPDWERIIFIATKARGFAAYLGLTDLANILARVSSEGRGGRSMEELLELVGDLQVTMDDTFEELKRVTPEAFSTLTDVSLPTP